MANSSCDLPEDIMYSCILTRLPVKSILRFKSVCKAWLHHFSTPEFVKSHQALFSSDPRNESLIAHNTSRGVNKTYFIDLQNKEAAMIVEHPYGPNSRNAHIVGCCNGLICMVGPGHVNGFVLLNPATRLSKFVPFLKFSSFSSLGFGYDVEGDDFKVVRIVSDGVAAEVYSVRSDSWTTIKSDIEYRRVGLWNECNSIVNGNPYWFVDGIVSGPDPTLVCFDATKQVFKTVPLPSFFHRREVKCELVDLNGSLGFLVWRSRYNSLYFYGRNEMDNSSLGAWAFDESYQTWSKTRNLGPVDEEVNAISWCRLFLKNGKIVGEKLYNFGKLFVIDPENGRVDEIAIHDPPKHGFDQVYGYTQSLTHI